jgi:16S rRNA C1402 (ribose-2'-O) methylase RsmI
MHKKFNYDCFFVATEDTKIRKKFIKKYDYKKKALISYNNNIKLHLELMEL